MKNIMIMSAFLLTGLTSTAYAENKTACFNVEGMTCTTCSLTIKIAVKKIDGIAKVDASFGSKNAVVSFDSGKTNTKEIKKKIDSTGYKATEITCKESKG